MSETTSAAEPEIPFVYRRPVFWGDTDTAQIAYTGKFVDYMLEAAEAWMRAYLDTDWWQMLMKEQRGGPVVHLEIDFMSPITPQDALEVEVRIQHLGTSAITYHCTGYGSDRRLSFRGSFTSVGFSYKNSAKQPWPDDARKIIEAYQADCAATDG